MTGPEHYAQAERLLGNTENTILDLTSQGKIPDASMVEAGLAAAQVHATLALAAATMQQDLLRRDLSLGGLGDQWREALS